MIDCGITFRDIKERLNFDLNISACLISHAHNDHAKSIKDIVNAGITIFTHKHVFEFFDLKSNGSEDFFLKPSATMFDDEWTVQPFPLFHDAPCYGFVISHKEVGSILFATDTASIPYRIKGISHFIIEANYSEKILTEKVWNEKFSFIDKRVIDTHLSVEKCVEFIKRSIDEKSETITLIHLSDRNSNRSDFKEYVRAATGLIVNVAENNKVYNLTI